MRKFLRMVGLIYVGYILVMLSGPPFKITEVSWICFIPSIIIIDKVNSKIITAMAGFINGVLIFGTIAHGIMQDLLLTALFYVSIMAGSFAISFLASKICLLKLPYYYSPLAVASIWTIIEYMLIKIGFHNTCGLVWFNQEYMRQIADITGAYGLTFIVIGGQVIIYKAAIFLFQKQFKHSVISLSMLVLMWGVPALYGYIKINENSKAKYLTKKLHVTAIKSEISAEDYSNAEKSVIIGDKIQKEFIGNMEKINDTSDLIICPETVDDFADMRVKERRKLLQYIAVKKATDIIYGCVDIDSAGRTYNSLFYISREGRIIDKYDKTKLLPFLESRYYRGQGVCPIQSNYGLLGCVICYEILDPSLIRQLVIKGAEILILCTNDCRLNRSIMADYYSDISIIRAVESGRYLMRASNYNKARIIDPSGKILKQTNTSECFFVSHSVFLLNKKTFYSIYGDLIIIVTLIILIVPLFKDIIKRIMQNEN